ncbi:MAG: autotransporter outer membrane beta-barrel domain-containing protein [Ferruginibacter sp.]|nr:autotransporter outer membrane beta-barrel domain-containing protein [Cytophagales bacterium]
MQAKNVLLTVASAVALGFAALTANAQIKEGTVLAGGGLSLDFGTHKNERPGSNQNTTVTVETRYTNFTFNPKVGYFFTDDLALGLNLNVNSNTNKNKDNGIRSTSSSYTFGVFGRYYFPQKLFLEGEAGFGRQSYNEDDFRNKIFAYSLGVGYAAFLNDHLALEPMIRYQGTQYTNSRDNRYRDKYGALRLGLGLQVYF